ncbi:hypothetical protein RHGRI_030545 [Rhododendron griersonianum]|uniref:Uncharacterized protein n=1 Tax=Rhododendron griersonianum TaxID=479676 RepID=A0AAV6IRK5_9ERIC|nr:hypothetical protein RHGRI_030545 [Rhododendron griersonianum]
MMRHISSSGSMDATTFADFVTSSLESRPIALPTVASNIDISCGASPPLPLSPRLSETLSSLRSPAILIFLVVLWSMIVVEINTLWNIQLMGKWIA